MVEPRTPFSTSQREEVAAKMLLDAKIEEFGAYIVSRDQARADELRLEAVALLRSLLDLKAKNLTTILRRGY